MVLECFISSYIIQPLGWFRYGVSHFILQKRQKPAFTDFCLFMWAVFLQPLMLALPIFPGSRPPSIVGANELNFCVRDGNRWTLIAINTNYVDANFVLLASVTLLSHCSEISLTTLHLLSNSNPLRWVLNWGYKIYPENWTWMNRILSRFATSSLLPLFQGQAFGLLVSVSLMHYCTYTPDLSTT